MFPNDPGKLKISADYYVNQPIENLKIRVKIVQQKSPLAELFESEAEVRDTNFLEAEEKTFKWQGKIFSASEINFYSEEKNCINDTHKIYHTKVIEGNIEPSRLFSYVHEDSYYHNKDLVTKSNYQSPLASKNATAIPKIHNKKPFTERHNKQVVDTKPSESLIRSNHYLYKSKKVMYIMVDLSSIDETYKDPEAAEILLCTVTYDKAGKILTVDPDFNSDGCYTLHEAGMSYDYWIEHASKSPTASEIRRLQDLFRHEMQDNVINRELKMFPELDLPPENILRLFLTLDLIAAHGFPYDAVFLTYTIDLPKHWSTNQRDRLCGRTQRSRMSNRHAHFSHITEISLDFDLGCLNDENVRPSWPYVLIAVASLDKWTRYRIEGYTCIPIPPTAGTYKYSVQTWRPVTGIINALRRFFTGGTVELDDIKYSGIPRDHQGSILDKTELRVVPNGTVDVEINIIQQSQSFIAKDTTKFKSSSSSSNNGNSSSSSGRVVYENDEALINSSESVLEQFRAARERMIQARNIK